MFCVKCGKELDREPINGLCMDCYLDGRKLMRFPHHVDLQKCTNCGEYLIGDRWLEREEDLAVEDAALNSMELALDGRLDAVGTRSYKEDERNYRVEVEADIIVGDVRITEQDSTIVRVKNTVCKKCSRQLGNYYEATLQVRSGDKELTDTLRDETVRRVRDSVEIQSKSNRSLFITSVKEVRGGVDFLLSSMSLARGLAKELTDAYGAEMKESESLVGMTADGIDMYRLTYLVRLPAYHVGDVVDYHKRPHLIKSLNKTGGRLIDLIDFRDTTARKNELQTMRILAKYTDRKDAVVITRDEKEIQVMHPVNYSTVDLRVPEGADIGDTVETVQVEDTLYYVF